MLRKRAVFESINDDLKNICNGKYSRHRSIHCFIMNLIAASGAYCFFRQKACHQSRL
ncbi:MAG: transposase [Tannerella sp.]|nr:transposase [Tannerella sp.]